MVFPYPIPLFEKYGRVMLKWWIILSIIGLVIAGALGGVLLWHLYNNHHSVGNLFSWKWLYLPACGPTALFLAISLGHLIYKGLFFLWALIYYIRHPR